MYSEEQTVVKIIPFEYDREKYSLYNLKELKMLKYINVKNKILSHKNIIPFINCW